MQDIIWKSLKEKQQPEVLRGRLLAVWGQWQRQGDVKNPIAHKLVDLTPMLGKLSTTSRDFHQGLLVRHWRFLASVRLFALGKQASELVIAYSQSKKRTFNAPHPAKFSMA